MGWGGKPTKDPIIPKSISRAFPGCAGCGGGVLTDKKVTGTALMKNNATKVSKSKVNKIR